MSYKDNLNNIDIELKKTFKTVSIDTEKSNNIEINLSSSILESVNDKLTMSLFISKHNLVQINPILEWGYYTDTIKKVNSITFKTPLNEMLSTIETIITKNRFNAEYLDTLVTETINENVDDNIDKEISIDDIYEVKGNDLIINRRNLREHFVHLLGFVIEDMVLSHFDAETGKPKGNFINNPPQLGDDNELNLSNIISMGHDGKISPKGWLSIEEELKKIPFVEDVYISTYKQSALVNISNEVFAELD